jgi:glycosyltransferase involved in cell wall biosynthesis
VSASVVIVLATYQGAPWLEEQVRSLQAQDHVGWRLLARDDGSTDGTQALLARLAREEPRLTVVGEPGRLGVVGNFATLLEAARQAGADYLLPCDQDDVWHPTRLSRALALMTRLEGTHGRATPLLVHSDLEVVDAALRPLHPSFLGFQGLRHEAREPLRVLLAQNFVTGCASLVNRALLELALPFPAACVMHDWWLAQCAAAAGAIGFDPEATVRYRQHPFNQVGAAGALGRLDMLRARGRRRLASAWRLGQQLLAQAGALEARLRERGGAPAEQLALVASFARLRGQGPLRRLATLRRLGVRWQRPVDTALFYALMAMLGLAARPGRGAAP